MNYKYDKNNYLKILYGGTKIKLLIEKQLPDNPKYEFKFFDGISKVEKKIISTNTEYKQIINLNDYFIKDDIVYILKGYLGSYPSDSPDRYQLIIIENNMHVDEVNYLGNTLSVYENHFKEYQKLKFDKNSHNIALATQVFKSGFKVDEEVYVGEIYSTGINVKYKIIEITDTGPGACVKLKRFSPSQQVYSTKSYELFKLDISKFKHIDGRVIKYSTDATSIPYEVGYGIDDVDDLTTGRSRRDGEKKTTGRSHEDRDGEKKPTDRSRGVRDGEKTPTDRSRRVGEDTSLINSGEFNVLSRTICQSIDNVIELLTKEKEKYNIS